jgi:hypothetical protein
LSVALTDALVGYGEPKSVSSFSPFPLAAIRVGTPMGWMIAAI